MDPVAPFLAVAAALGAYAQFSRSRKRLGDARSVERAWLAAYPGDEVRHSVLSRDGRAALVETGWGTGLLCRGGEVARRLDRAETEIDDAGLVILLPGLEPPRIRLKLDPTEAALWQERIGSA
jgi:hypothetical protein